MANVDFKHKMWGLDGKGFYSPGILNDPTPPDLGTGIEERARWWQQTATRAQMVKLLKMHEDICKELIRLNSLPEKPKRARTAKPKKVFTQPFLKEELL